jgi:hypothetical protein
VSIGLRLACDEPGCDAAVGATPDEDAYFSIRWGQSATYDGTFTMPGQWANGNDPFEVFCPEHSAPTE